MARALELAQGVAVAVSRILETKGRTEAALTIDRATLGGDHGVIDRGIYRIAVLYDPAQPDYAPWAPQPGFNGKALMTFDAVHVAIGTNVKKQRAFDVAESQRLIERSIVEQWPQAAGKWSTTESGTTLARWLPGWPGWPPRLRPVGFLDAELAAPGTPAGAERTHRIDQEATP